MSRTFAQIETGLPHSRKMRQLSHAERWAYLCAHLSPLGGYLGTFRYPLTVWADDADLTRNEIEGAIGRMIEVGLIDFDHRDDVIRIRGWFLKKNAPENASRMASLAADFQGADFPDYILMASAAEFAVGSIKRAQRWKPDSVEWVKLREVFKPYLASMRTEFEDDFHAALASVLEGQNRAVKAEISALMPSMEFYLNPPCPHRGDTVGAQYTTRDEDETDTKKRKDEKNTGHFSNGGKPHLAAVPSPTAANAENGSKMAMPHPETIAAAKRIGGQI